MENTFKFAQDVIRLLERISPRMDFPRRTVVEFVRDDSINLRPMVIGGWNGILVRVPNEGAVYRIGDTVRFMRAKFEVSSVSCRYKGCSKETTLGLLGIQGGDL